MKVSRPKTEESLETIMDEDALHIPGAGALVGLRQARAHPFYEQHQQHLRGLDACLQGRGIREAIGVGNFN